ncbi:hypothetical protein Poly30_42310 [Planctomycetes bacterium Poly30]|uniref:Uncharacterized protein n=1 Tax=Saltatorellus ferox TaxID=2528018 RepID=A0A518EX70_9BACT|nr:hypothetical protein Poly30_42310 [Planctomycetes bacterium Poly30]
MPRLIDQNHCPHCGIKLEAPLPRVCPECAGSLQQRYLKAGCLSSGPAIFLAGLAYLAWQIAA